MKTVNYIKKNTNNSTDITYKEIKISNKNIWIIYAETLSDSEKVNTFIMNNLNYIILKKIKIKNIIDYLYNTIPTPSIKKITNKEIIDYLYKGFTIILIDSNSVLAIETRESLDRGISESKDEPILRGSKDSFTENINKNIGLVRKRIRNKDLILKDFYVGKYSKTKIGIMYINTICEDLLVKEIIKKIETINVDGILDSGYVRELVFDDKKNIFPTVVSTERPDKASMALLEGKIILIIDNSPYVLITPSFFIDFFKVPEDYYVKSITTTLVRLLRLLCFIISVLLPAFYIAFTTYNKESIPTNLLLNFAEARKNVPIPTILESLIMIIGFEILKESDMRLPSILGSSVSLLGTLVLGEAAISAGIASPIVIMVIALSLISSFVFSDTDFVSSIRIWRIIFLISASIFGLYGIFLCIIILIINLCSLKSMGKPYLYPFAPFNLDEIKDSFIRLNKKKLNKRNKILTKNIIRLR